MSFDETNTNADNRAVLGMLNKYIGVVEDIITLFESKGLIE
jgi:hypothetical protein